MAGGYAKEYDLQAKLLTIGNSGVGKTCLLNKYSEGQFKKQYITTIGIDFKVKIVTVGGTRVKLQIWDTAGQERFRTITTSYFRGAHGILLVYDITDVKSFHAVEDWMREIKRLADADVNVILLGNKADMEKERAVTAEQGKELADKHRVPFFETSAKTDLNVNEAFETLAGLVKDRQLRRGAKGGADASGAVRISAGAVSAGEKKKSCCSS